MQVLTVWSSLHLKGSMVLLYMDKWSAPKLTSCEVTMTSRVGSRRRLHMWERLSWVAERGSCEFYSHVIKCRILRIFTLTLEKKYFSKFAAIHYCKYILLQPVLGGSSYNLICTLLNEYKSCINHSNFCTLKHYIFWDMSPLAPFKGRLPVVRN
jgi:hypothetical protein